MPTEASTDTQSTCTQTTSVPELVQASTSTDDQNNAQVTINRIFQATDAVNKSTPRKRKRPICQTCTQRGHWTYQCSTVPILKTSFSVWLESFKAFNDKLFKRMTLLNPQEPERFFHNHRARAQSNQAKTVKTYKDMDFAGNDSRRDTGLGNMVSKLVKTGSGVIWQN